VIAWRVKAVARGACDFGGELEASAPGLTLRAALTLPRDAQPGTWRVHDATIAVVDWWARGAARAKVPVQPADLRLGGTLRVAGEGTWTDAGLSGALHLTLTEGTAASDEQAWSAREITLEAEVILGGPAGVALRAADAKIESVQVVGIAVRNILLSLAAGERGQIAVRRAQLEVFGGRLALSPFTLDPTAPAIRTAAEFSGIALGELAALVPQALAEARGQVAGRMAVNWNLDTGAQPDAGGVEMAPGAPATFRLEKSPGLLTGRAAPRIEFLPAWTGPLRRWFSADNPAYETLRRIELGETPLTLDSLLIKFLPDGPEGSRSASVVVGARPAAGTAVERVTFSVNLTGPLTQVLRLGMDERMRVQIPRAR
jgi:hypothetical protein